MLGGLGKLEPWLLLARAKGKRHGPGLLHADDVDAHGGRRLDHLADPLVQGLNLRQHRRIGREHNLVLDQANSDNPRRPRLKREKKKRKEKKERKKKKRKLASGRWGRREKEKETCSRGQSILKALSSKSFWADEAAAASVISRVLKAEASVSGSAPWWLVLS